MQGIQLFVIKNGLCSVLIDVSPSWEKTIQLFLCNIRKKESVSTVAVAADFVPPGMLMILNRNLNS